MNYLVSEVAANNTHGIEQGSIFSISVLALLSHPINIILSVWEFLASKAGWAQDYVIANMPGFCSGV